MGGLNKLDTSRKTKKRVIGRRLIRQKVLTAQKQYTDRLGRVAIL